MSDDDIMMAKRYQDDDEDAIYSTKQEKQNDHKSNQYAFEVRQTALQYVKQLIIMLLLTFMCCMWTLRDSFWCSGGTEQDCEDIRKNMSCKKTVVSPMWNTMTLKIGNQENPNTVEMGVFCGWETASS